MRIILRVCWEQKNSEGGVCGGVIGRSWLRRISKFDWREKKKRGRIEREKVRKWNRLKRGQEEEEYIKEREEKQREESKES